MLSRLRIAQRGMARAMSAKPRIVTQLLIDGKFQDSASGKTFDTINPATEEKIASVAEAGEEDVNRAVAAAKRAFNEGPWRRMKPAERARLIYKLADLIEKNIDELAALESMDNGKPLSVARNVELPLAVNGYRYYAGWADKLTGKTIPVNGSYFCFTRHEPVGVCGQIIPWNFPVLMQVWKLAPALATGNTVIMKPAEQTPLTALRIAELAMEAGFPPGVINVLSGFGPTVGRPLVKHPDVDKIAFTGSTEVGYEIMRGAGEVNIKRVTLELGGKSPNIIFSDVDVEAAIVQSQLGLFLNQGQCCVAGSRLFVEERIYDEFVEKSVAAAKKRVLGDPMKPETDQGPQVDQEQMTRIMGYIDRGRSEGAKLMCGGNRWGQKGFFVEPTVFADVKDDMVIAKEEIFGPVMTIMKFSEKDMGDLIRRANDSKYGLGAGIMTRDYTKALRVANELRAGTVYVNCYDVFDPAAPFGGYKDSGVGRELGEEALKNYMEVKTVFMATNPDSLP